ncbi:hypothetical protein ES319_A10G204700v1 [Gossypium barbadense]|uniref:Disease resistance RPP13-like protein 1 n=3 Tax=Gossypium TaxID=3633 RepID=A0A2P5YWG5_GOSBA|nr:hypothetical protein ES319_A10G204700v1 [Gossypium barbadense]PPS19899.1 hypothetical protein GOBAR_AA00658 [Gossypium barbadense]TYG99859.1 hypothetical protein ES288_A10G229800v1 [Gossypium darwinii]
MPLLEALTAIREVVVSKVIDFLLDKLALSDFLQFPTEKEVQEMIEKLKEELKAIRAVLDDAEERQLKEQSVKIWLTNLQNLAYDVEDVLDEFETDICKFNFMMERRGSSSKRPKLIPDSFNVFMFHRDMMSKIKDLTTKLKELEPQKHQLQFKVIGSERPKRLDERLHPTSMEIECHVYGRDKDKQTVLDLLLKSDNEGNFVIPIVGMGGIGKTTLAQLVYNDASIRKHFDLKAWVCVSDDFDVRRITKEILQSITSKPCNDDLNTLQEKLKRELEEKKFLIVLDDVWNENYHNWTILQSPFLTKTKGSKVIVTTRNHGVSSTMGAFHAHSLEVLSDDACLPIFAQHALGARDFGGHPNLKEVAKKIVRKCNGLPLAAKTLGGLLRTNVDLDAWEDVLKSEIWKLSEHQSGIIPALQLSYHHLPLHLKRCFAYCAIFPKDYEFEKEEIILLWRAQGFLQEAPEKQITDDLGHKYFRDLVSRSLLQISIKDNSRFVMHDLINDLAQSVAGEICFKIEGNQQISKHARHLSYIANEYDGIKKFEGIYEAQHLRTFLPLRLCDNCQSHITYSFLTNDVLMYLLPNLRCLRALSLEGYHITRLSDFLKDLKHLRYLNFSHTSIKSLPESVSTLYNLETLLLKECKYLEKLPSEMEKLVNLCHLDMTGADRLEGMPSNFSMLTNLQTLSVFVLGKGKGYQIEELKDLSNLKGELCILGLQNIVEPRDAWMAKLCDKSRLEKLEFQFEWSSARKFENRIKEVEKKVLDGLQPSKNLKELTIKYYCGAMLANWVGDSSFNGLQSLCIDDCPNLLTLPSIGKLPLLKMVCIRRLESVTSVGDEFFGENTKIAFPSLEILEFFNMPEWENWNFFEVDKEARKFPKLRELLIQSCPSLLGSIPEYLPSLEKLTIRDCKKMIISIQGFPMLSEIEIHRCHEVVYKGFANDSSLERVSFSCIPKFTCAVECMRLRPIKVQSLEIDDCEELFSFRENNWRCLTQSMSLGILRISTCPQLASIGAEEERQESMQLKIPYNIEKLMIRNCERLEKLSTTLHCLTSVRVIKLNNCPKLISLTRSNLPLNLKVLSIRSCKKLQCLLLDGGGNVNSSNACALRRLVISDCESLKRINRSELPSTLKQLTISWCQKLELVAQEIQDNSSLELLHISSCDNIKELPQGLSKLKHLQSICISSCSNLISFPESGLPTTNLKVLRLRSCELLQTLPKNMYCFNSLEELTITKCPNVTSFLVEGLPTNLLSLNVEGPNICKPIIEWGLHRLTSLKYLWIENGCRDAESFPQDELGITLPPTLTRLCIYGFPKLESLSSNGFRNLTSLEWLFIYDCPNLKSLLGKNMLSSLLLLQIHKCPVLKERCKKEEGPDWSNIAHIPFVYISNKRCESWEA